MFLLNALFPEALTTGDDMARLAFFALLFLVIVSSASLPRLEKGPNFLSAAVVWAGASSALLAGFAFEDELREQFDRRLGARASMAAVARAPGEVEITRTWDGHFRAWVEVGDTAAPFLIDTGASLVLMRWEDAEAMGVDMASLRFEMPVLTANGEAMVAPLRVPLMRIGAVAVQDVRAAVAPKGTLQGGLLGMSFLGRLHEMTIRGDKVILKN
ncbi:retropepsin-like aspartic protease family protein [Rhodovulum sp. DZ06]|uniref:retropepsin-like aspartic protease family protein n=1 Tax=Rhodovulum sp. DZ06 TaxID=3425126 RepID=UPI003D349D2C